MLFMLSWVSDASWVVDAPDSDEALRRGVERIGSEPTLVRELPSSLVSFDVLVRPDPADAEMVVVELVPDEATAELLSAWEEEANEVAEVSADTEPPPSGERCGSTADTDEDEEVRCTRPVGHLGSHVGGAQDGLEWS